VHQVVGQLPRHLVPPTLGSPGVPVPGAPTTPSHPSGTLGPPALNGWKASESPNAHVAWGQPPSAPSSAWSHERLAASGGTQSSGGPNLRLAPETLSNYGPATGGTSAVSPGSRAPLLPGPAVQSGSGLSTAAGIALALAALLVALMAVRPPPSLRRLAIAPATLRPAPELGTPDRPG
jgi:hypothetical protein